ncbi:MAG: hypothetical protein JRJ85_23425, partial [Deltaproteobacteria bacterium]|nr:hypothetical protein [Deltaproteobacteria bacterium]
MAEKLNFYKAPKNGKTVQYLDVAFEGSKSISDIALLACVNPEEVIDSITTLNENYYSRKQLWDKYASPFLSEISDKSHRKKELENALGPMLIFLDRKDRAAALNNTAEFLEKDDNLKAFGIAVARKLGAEYSKWRLNPGFVILLAKKEYMHYEVCRVSKSVAGQKKEKVKAFKKVVEDLLPELKRLESAIEKYEKTSKEWMKSPNGGEEALKAMAILNAADSITRVYAMYDDNVSSVNAVVKDLENVAGENLRQNLFYATQYDLVSLREIAYDDQFNDALLEFLITWDPSDHYYWHTQVANTVAGASDPNNPQGFDERVFRAVRRLAEYLSADGDTAEYAGEECNYAIREIYKTVMELTANGVISSRHSHEVLVGEVLKKYKNIKSTSKNRTGFLTTFALWSGYFSSWFGNFEGPPSVLSVALGAFTKSDRF